MAILTLPPEVKAADFEIGQCVRYEGRIYNVLNVNEAKNQLQIDLDRRNRKQRRAHFAAIKKAKSNGI